MHTTILVIGIVLGLGAILGMILAGFFLWAADRRIRRRRNLHTEEQVTAALAAYERGA